MSLYIGFLLALSALLGPAPARLLCQMTGEERPTALSCCNSASEKSVSAIRAPGCCTLRPGEDHTPPTVTVLAPLAVALPPSQPVAINRLEFAPESVAQTICPLPLWRGPPLTSLSPRAPPV